MSKKLINSLPKLLWIGGVAVAIGLMQHPVLSEPDLDNIYHEDDNLPDNADVFPRLGRIAGEQEQTNCRTVPWGSVVTQFSGNSMIEIDRRQVDRNGDSWFHSSDRNCWIHDSRIDLL